MKRNYLIINDAEKFFNIEYLDLEVTLNNAPVVLVNGLTKFEVFSKELDVKKVEKITYTGGDPHHGGRVPLIIQYTNNSE